jgi:hypothetical protein
LKTGLLQSKQLQLIVQFTQLFLSPSLYGQVVAAISEKIGLSVALWLSPTFMLHSLVPELFAGV